MKLSWVGLFAFFCLFDSALAQKANLKTPAVFIDERASQILKELKRRPIRAVSSGTSRSGSVQLGIQANKAEWLRTLYSQGLIEASWATSMLSDKRLLFEVLHRELKNEARNYYPKTIGLREFLVGRGFINRQGELVADGERIEKALYEEFSAGFIVRPAVGIAPNETGRGLYRDADAFIIDLVSPGSRLYSVSHYKQPVRSHILNHVASGEALVLQEDIVTAAATRKALKTRFFHKVRMHTYEDEVVSGAMPERWVQQDLLTAEETAAAEKYVAEFLKKLPKIFLQRQAWGVDVAVLDGGEMRIIDVVTNRGRPIQWSGYLDQPRVIAAYAKHFEKMTDIRFSGFGGFVVRNGLANYFPYWEKRIQRARPGLSKALAYLPPLP